MDKFKYMQNRELSWLKFNKRVLKKGADESVPLYERLKFTSIFDSNMTEFFNVRVGSLTDIYHLDSEYKDSKTNMTVKEELESIYDAVRPLYEMRDQIYHNLEDRFRNIGISNLKYDELNEQQKNFVNSYYEKEVKPMMSPNVVDIRHPFPFIENNLVYVIAEIKNKKRNTFLILPVRDALPKYIKLPNSNNYILIEEIFYKFVDELVPNFEISNKYLVRVTRNADVDLEQDADEEVDYKKFVQKKLKNRRILVPVRLEVNKELSKNTKEFLIENLEITDEMIYTTSAPLKMNYVWGLSSIIDPSLLSDLTYEKYSPRKSNMIDLNEKLMPQVEDHDVFLSYPFESMDTFIKLLREASMDPRVFSIKITLYRMASNSKVIKYITRAAEEGKEVSVVVELRARFDEANNIDYSEDLIEAGVNVLYGIERYKVHTKICLISYKDDEQIKYITHIGTGNYNESTAKIYQDMNIITANSEIGKEASTFFNNMQLGQINNSYNYLIQSPSTLKPKILELIDREIKKGSENGYIRLKCNSITDKGIIQKLAEASQAGIKIDLLIRGICCIVPGIEGYTENITVRSIVGRYLEHARIYQFGKGDMADLYIASADLMTRNTERRVELGLPVLNRDIKRYLMEFLDNQFKDNVNGTELTSDKTYADIEGDLFDSHRYYMQNEIEYLRRENSENKSMNNSENNFAVNDVRDNIKQEIKKDKVEKKYTLLERLRILFKGK